MVEQGTKGKQQKKSQGVSGVVKSGAHADTRGFVLSAMMEHWGFK